MFEVWLSRIVTVPFVIVALALMFTVVKTAAVKVLATDSTGVITRVAPNVQGRAHDRFDVAFTYDAGDGTRPTATAVINAASGQPPHIGEVRAIRRLSFQSHNYAELADGNESVTGMICVGTFMTVWCSVVAKTTFNAWVEPIKERRLIANGEAVVGTIVDKKEIGRGKSRRKAVSYRFETLNAIKEGGVAVVSDRDFQQLDSGDALLVLYDVKRPRVSLPLRFSSYRVIHRSRV